MYSEKNVKAFGQIKKVFEASSLPLMRIRKANGILNAIEMQIEDDDYSAEVVSNLLNALKMQTRWLGLESLMQDLDKAISHFIGVLGHKKFQQTK